MALASAACWNAPPKPTLIPRQVLFGNPSRTGGRISPDGRWLGYLAPVNGVLNIHVSRRDVPDDVTIVTRSPRDIREFSFAFDNEHLLYALDNEGDENFQVFAVRLTGGEPRALTPRGARAEIDNTSARRPHAILVNLNDRDPAFFDLVRIDIRTGATERLVENREFVGFVTDEDLVPRYASQQTPDGGKAWFVRDGDGWKPWEVVPPDDAVTTYLGGFTADGRTLYLVDSRGRDRSGLFALDTATGTRVLLHEDPRADVGLGLVHPETGVVQAVPVEYLEPEWKVLDPGVAKDFETLGRLAGGGRFSVEARTQDDRVWLVRIDAANAASRIHLYDRTTGEARLWHDTQPEWAGLSFQPAHAVEIRSRDGLTLPSSYILPPGSDPDGDGIPARPVPAVMHVHGGPWSRDTLSFSTIGQWLANRGYAVVSVNFRGSTGFGKAFVNAGNREWGGRMQEDLLDAAAWATERRIARPGRIAILGISYGGYAALAGMTMTPGSFACGVSVVGPSNLNTLLATIPPYWGPTRRLFTTRVGDPDTAEGRALLEARSPLTHVARIEGPLLIGQGAHDPRVKSSESDQIVSVMQAKGIPVTYALFPDEGHGFARPQNSIAFSAVVEEFLGGCLGGAVEPLGDDFEGSSITIPAGASLLPGISASTYQVRLLGVTPPKLLVTASLWVEGRALMMDETRPANTEALAMKGWPALVSNLSVTDVHGGALEVEAAGVAGWLLPEPRSGRVLLQYEVDYSTLAAQGWPAPRESGLTDEDHVVLHGRSMFITTDAMGPSTVSFTMPSGWLPVTPWEPRAGTTSDFEAGSSGDLVENLLVFTRDRPDQITAGGFRLLVAPMGHWQQAGAEVHRVLGAVIPRVVDLMGDGGHGRYLVVLLPTRESGGESYRRSFALTLEEAPARANSAIWGNLIAHEVMHRWNGWQLRGAEYAASQWFQEGFTEYAANVSMAAAGLLSPEEFLDKLSVHVGNSRRLETTLEAPGTHKGPPLYSGGALVAFLWDVKIRAATAGQRNLWSFMGALWEQTGRGRRPYDWPALRAALTTTADLDWEGFHRSHIRGNAPLPLDETLALAGLRLGQGPDGTPRIEVAPGAADSALALGRGLTRFR